MATVRTLHLSLSETICYKKKEEGEEKNGQSDCVSGCPRGFRYAKIFEKTDLNLAWTNFYNVSC